MNKVKQFFVLLFSIILAWVLMRIHLPVEWQSLRPEWLALILIYWAFKEPEWVGVGVAWFAGLGMDVIDGSLLGSNALAMSVIVYFAHHLRFRLRLFPFWQQLFVVLLLVTIGKLVLLSIQWLIGQPPRSLAYWYSSLTSVLMWPVVSKILNYFNRSNRLRSLAQ